MSFIFPIRIFQFLGLLPSPRPDNSSEEGKIIEVIRSNEEWLIKVHGVYWKARSTGLANFQKGDRVRVIGHRIVGNRVSNTLMIESCDD